MVKLMLEGSVIASRLALYGVCQPAQLSLPERFRLCQDDIDLAVCNPYCGSEIVCGGHDAQLLA